MSEQILSAGHRAGQAATAAGSVGATYFGYTLSELGVIVGIATALIGLAMQWHFGRETLKIKKLAYSQLGAKADAVETDRGALQ
jgi:hypothetical protein